MAKPKVTAYLLFLTFAICLGSMQFGYHLVPSLPIPSLDFASFADIFLLGRDEHAGVCHVMSNRQESDCRYATMDTWMYLHE